MEKQAGVDHGPARSTSTASWGSELFARALAWRLLLPIGLILTASYVVLPHGLLTSTLYVLLTAGAALAAGLAALHRPRPFAAGGWGLIAIALALAAIGHGIWYWLDLQGLEPFPSAADIFYLLVYPLFVVALWRLGDRNVRADGAFVDALIIGISAAVLAWALLIAPYAYDPSLSWLQLLVSAGYPVADLILLPLVLRLLFLHRAHLTAHVFLLLGMLAYLTADLLYAHGNATGWYAPGGLTDAGWLIAYTLIVAAVWHPSAQIEPQVRTSAADVSGRRLLVLGAAVVLVPMIILFTAGDDMETIRVAAIASILMFVLVLYRMAGMLRESHRQAHRLEHLSRTDPLTGAGNRRQLEEQLSREIARAERTQGSLNVALLDLDRFKRFNDTHGHSAGDALLQEIVHAWRPNLRPTDVLTRFGGEESVLISPHIDTQQCDQLLQRLRAVVPYGQTFSAGIASFHAGDTPDDLLGRADRALYAAKSSGRARNVIADDHAAPSSNSEN
ncbi:GGDEF domain-containing protein [Thioalkalivibrio sp. ALJ1]|uniref:GGDEF domain-containing protein n=1 Tax=Thioalkalivibrio sp. ALJ1 TaxID=1158144 RepID=UPI00068B1435